MKKMGVLWLTVITLIAGAAFADETCQSPFLPKVTGQEDYIYVWTLGIKGVADGNDSLVTVDANPTSKTYGQMIGAICGPAAWTTALSLSSTLPQIRPSQS
jgi:selenium-binding protein 1